jgi:hypothetical protein
MENILFEIWIDKIIQYLKIEERFKIYLLNKKFHNEALKLSYQITKEKEEILFKEKFGDFSKILIMNSIVYFSVDPIPFSKEGVYICKLDLTKKLSLNIEQKLPHTITYAVYKSDENNMKIFLNTKNDFYQNQKNKFEKIFFKKKEFMDDVIEVYNFNIEKNEIFFEKRTSIYEMVFQNQVLVSKNNTYLLFDSGLGIYNNFDIDKVVNRSYAFENCEDDNYEFIYFDPDISPQIETNTNIFYYQNSIFFIALKAKSKIYYLFEYKIGLKKFFIHFVYGLQNLLHFSHFTCFLVNDTFYILIRKIRNKNEFHDEVVFRTKILVYRIDLNKNLFY